MSAALFIVALALVLLWGWWMDRDIDGGRWHCLLCQTVGYGGVTGWDEHYLGWHYNERKRGT